jgi:hypothetical protein
VLLLREIKDWMLKRQEYGLEHKEPDSAGIDSFHLTQNTNQQLAVVNAVRENTGAKKAEYFSVIHELFFYREGPRILKAFCATAWDEDEKKDDD